MKTNVILEAIDQEILKLRQVRALLATNVINKPIIKERGRPKGSINRHVIRNVSELVKRTMSAEGKARIAAAQKKRWAAVKKASKPVKSAAVAAKHIAKPAKAKKIAPVKKLPFVKKAQPEVVATAA
jgi:hypothetical protein